MFNPDSASLVALPRITPAQALSGHAAQITQADGASCTISSAQPRVFLAPFSDELVTVFIEDFQASRPAAYFIPTCVLPAFRAAVQLRRVTA